MKILLTGVTGYIGKRLLPILLEQGHDVICCTRDKNRFQAPDFHKNQITVFEVDFLKPIQLDQIDSEIDIAFYLIHSMSSSSNSFEELESLSANNFVNFIQQTNTQQIIYLSGIINEENLSQHLSSRKEVEKILVNSSIPLTTLRAGIIVGSGSSSFEIIRDLTEKLPIMVAPRWLKTLSQPISVRNVIDALVGIIGKEQYYNQSYDIGGNEILDYKQILLEYARIRKLKRYIITVPVLTPKLSSYWLFFVTAVNFSLAKSLVDSMTINVLCKPNNLFKELNITPLTYQQAIENAFQKIEQNMVLSSWKDAFISSNIDVELGEFIHVPQHGCYKDTQIIPIKNKNSIENVINNIWNIGGARGWYYATSLWKLRGYLDKLIGGVGLRRGKTNENDINSGDALDFWRVIYAEKEEKRLLLFAEMKTPGEAWLEFSIIEKKGEFYLKQEATFRPHGLLGRLYWAAMYPFHLLIFHNMAKRIVSFN